MAVGKNRANRDTENGELTTRKINRIFTNIL